MLIVQNDPTHLKTITYARSRFTIITTTTYFHKIYDKKWKYVNNISVVSRQFMQKPKIKT